MQQAELRMLLADCARLWGQAVRLIPERNGIAVLCDAGRFILYPATADERPARWLLILPDRRERRLPSIAAALRALRSAVSR